MAHSGLKGLLKVARCVQMGGVQIFRDVNHVRSQHMSHSHPIGMHMTTHNPLRKLPSDVLKNVRDYASDRVQPHQTAALIKDSVFNRDVLGEHSDGYPSLYVSNPFITKRMRKCSDWTCLTCMRGNWSCRNSRLVTRPAGCRRYITSDFCEPDRYMEDYRPKTVVGEDGNVRPTRTAWGLASEQHAFSPPIHTDLEP